MGTFDEQIAFELSDGVDHIHGHLASRTSEIDPSQGEAVDTDTYLFELCDGCADIDGIAAQSVKLSDDQHIAMFHFIEQFGKSFPLRDGHGARDGFCDDTVRLDGEPSSLDFPDLIFWGLIKGGDTGICESARRKANLLRNGCTKQYSCPIIFQDNLWTVFAALSAIVP